MAFPRQFSELKVFETTDPAVDTLPAPIVVPVGERWRIQGFTFSLESSATAGNRLVYLYLDRGVGTQAFQFISSGYLQPAVKMTDWNFGPGMSNSNAVATANTL